MYCGIALSGATFRSWRPWPSFWLRCSVPAQPKGHCVQNSGGGYTCSWGYEGPTGAGAWWFFDGANPARNWYANQGLDNYATAVGKCVRAGMGGGQIYRERCGWTHHVAQEYARCNCGGIYVGTQNLASGSRQINSMGWH
jgi:hypothetical protein